MLPHREPKQKTCWVTYRAGAEREDFSLRTSDDSSLNGSGCTFVFCDLSASDSSVKPSQTNELMVSEEAVSKLIPGNNPKPVGAEILFKEKKSSFTLAAIWRSSMMVSPPKTGYHQYFRFTGRFVSFRFALGGFLVIGSVGRRCGVLAWRWVRHTKWHWWRGCIRVLALILFPHLHPSRKVHLEICKRTTPMFVYNKAAKQITRVMTESASSS